MGLALGGADAAEEVAEEEETPLPSALRHALLRVTLEAALFYALLLIAMACGLSDGDTSDHGTDALAYLADALVGGWGEAAVTLVSGAVFVAACEFVRGVVSLTTTCGTRHPEGSSTTRGICGSRALLDPEIPQVAKAPIGMTCA
jgi:hypothetical protein